MERKRDFMCKKIGSMNLKVENTEFDVYLDMAIVMLDEIIKNNNNGKSTVMIVPVGPTGQSVYLFLRPSYHSLLCIRPHKVRSYQRCYLLNR